MVSIQSNMQLQDELAALFSRNLTFNPDLGPNVLQQLPSHEEDMAEANSNQPATYSISQHYNHSTTAATPVHSGFQRASSEPSQGESNTSQVLLRIHGISPDTLTPSQLQLFRVADAPQRRRLIELWSICPPSTGGDIPALAWSSTTVEQEEQLAQLRYERQQQEQQTQVMSLDGTMVQADDSHWIHQEAQVSSESEPYMLSGYEELMRRERQQQALVSTIPRSIRHNPATDPVYLGPDYARQMLMAQQYGAFEQHSREADAMDM